MICAWTLCLSQPPLWANPEGGAVVAGGAAINPAGPGALTINQSTMRAIINWQNFSINAGEFTKFIQPSTAAATLNRVLSANPSAIYGTLQANGQIFLLNPNGIVVGPGGRIEAGSFVGSTLNITDAAFMAGGDLKFLGTSTAGIKNFGSIEAIGGDVYLMAHTVENEGSIRAPSGTVGLAAGSSIQLVQQGSEKLSVLVGNDTAPQAAAGVNNNGVIQSAAAELKAAGGNIYALAINNGGVVRATGVVRENGRIYLRATGGNIQNSGTLAAKNANGSGGTVVVDGGHNAAALATVVNSGVIEARGDAAGTKGGTVQMLGDHVGMFDKGSVDVSGDFGGGTALIGGDYRGGNPGIQNASAAYFSPEAQIKADALTLGDGGKVIVWSDDSTRFYGSISARGGALGGNGGFVETSGKSFLEVSGSHVDASALLGDPGMWLLDPWNVTINAGATGGGTFNGGTPNVFTPTATLANADRDDIQTSLNGGTSVTITTGSTGGEAGNITVGDSITRTLGAGYATLTLNAAGAITVNSGSTIAGSAAHPLNV
ncbi:MAG: filamentous hemagglutinin N-terminal domain-containing protein, partial [Verrucomicrobia bacterium]|nr:filamentous hemagglutinin N-terminal domain-containing protein [Verrucomicrobiota bacterium]